MLIALTGNQNCGKTTLFNRLTGATGHTGNFPGVTVEYSAGALRGAQNITIMDLPGTYSLTPYSPEEAAAKEALLQADAIINLVDAGNLPRNLYLTLQLTELQHPMILVVNMMDEANRRGIHIDLPRLSERLKIPVIGISAKKGDGIPHLISSIRKNQFAVPRSLAPARHGEDYLQTAQRRYKMVEQLCNSCLFLPSEKFLLSQKLDRIALHPFYSLPLFFGILLGIFFLTFGPFGNSCKEMTEQQILRLGIFLTEHLSNLPPLLHSLLVDGIFRGVGSVLSFLPCICILFFCFSLLEDSGYLARISFLADKPMQAIGLSGRSVIPFLTGFGCTVPAAAAARTLPSQREKILTVLFLPFVSCSAKLPVYTVITDAIFPHNGYLLIFLLYSSGLLWGVLNAAFTHRFLLSAPSESFVLELPPYRMPDWKTTLRCTLRRAADFIEKAFTVIFLASMLIWFCRTFTPTLQPVNRFEHSILITAGKHLANLFAPLGFGSPETAAALLAGLGAKEAVISTLSILCREIADLFTPLSAFAFLTFVLLYMPCAAAFAAIKREIGFLSALLAMIYQTAFAWIISFLVYQIGSFFLIG